MSEDGEISGRKRDRDEVETITKVASPRKKVISSVVAISSSSADDAFTKVSRPVVRDTGNPETAGRNRRLFGALMGHLGKARETLSRDSGKIELQSTQKNAAAEKNMQESMRVREIHDEVRTKGKEKAALVEKLDTLKETVNDLPDLAETWKAHQVAMEGFLLTEAEPRLFWMPTIKNNTNKQLFTARLMEVQRNIDERDSETRKEIEATEIEITDVEEQIGVIDDFIKSKGGHMSTETEAKHVGDRVPSRHVDDNDDRRRVLVGSFDTGYSRIGRGQQSSDGERRRRDLARNGDSKRRWGGRR
jgi:hypothetical protein